MAFPFIESEAAAAILGCEGGQPIELAIWTTTPWTLPANRGVALSAALEYVVLAHEGRRVLVAEALAEVCAQRFGFDGVEIVGRATGADLEGLLLSPPFADEPVPIVLGEHVTTDAGTGCVHTAPAHGLEDFDMGRRYDLEVYNPVGGNGVYHPDTPVFAGQHIFKANDDIVAALERNVLLCHQPFQHSYRIAGATRRRLFFARPPSGLSVWRATDCLTPPKRRWRTCNGCRTGVGRASTPCWQNDRTGASRDSEPGAYRSHCLSIR